MQSVHIKYIQFYLKIKAWVGTINSVKMKQAWRGYDLLLRWSTESCSSWPQCDGLTSNKQNSEKHGDGEDAWRKWGKRDKEKRKSVSMGCAFLSGLLKATEETWHRKQLKYLVHSIKMLHFIVSSLKSLWGLARWLSDKESTSKAGDEV